jgi:hypothetical protein
MHRGERAAGVKVDRKRFHEAIVGEYNISLYTLI